MSSHRTNDQSDTEQIRWMTVEKMLSQVKKCYLWGCYRSPFLLKGKLSCKSPNANTKSEQMGVFLKLCECWILVGCTFLGATRKNSKTVAKHLVTVWRTFATLKRTMTRVLFAAQLEKGLKEYCYLLYVSLLASDSILWSTSASELFSVMPPLEKNKTFWSPSTLHRDYE